MSHQKTVQQSIASLERAFQKQASLKHSFVRGVVGGVGYALGASLVAGIVLVLLLRIVQTIDYIPLVKGLIDSEEIQKSLREALGS